MIISLQNFIHCNKKKMAIKIMLIYQEIITNQFYKIHKITKTNINLSKTKVSSRIRIKLNMKNNKFQRYIQREASYFKKEI
jgi:hypothetical protein